MTNQILKSTEEKTLMHTVKIKGFTEAWQSYIVHVNPRGECKPRFSPAIKIFYSWTKLKGFLINRFELFKVFIVFFNF